MHGYFIYVRDPRKNRWRFEEAKISRRETFGNAAEGESSFLEVDFLLRRRHCIDHEATGRRVGREPPERNEEDQRSVTSMRDISQIFHTTERVFIDDKFFEVHILVGEAGSTQTRIDPIIV